MADPLTEVGEATEKRGQEKLDMGVEEFAVAAGPWRGTMRKARNWR